MDAFSDFVTLVVPKVGQEIATWKYDVRRKERKLTVFRLSYEDDITSVADCLSLQFCTLTSDPSAYSLIPTLCTGGKKKEPAFVQNILGKSSLNSVLDIDTLLTYLDRLDNRDGADSSVLPQIEAVEGSVCHFKREGSVNTPIDSYDEGDSDSSWEAPKKRKGKSRLPKRPTQRSRETSAEKPPKKPRRSAHAKTGDDGDKISGEIPQAKPKRGRGRPRKQSYEIFGLRDASILYKAEGRNPAEKTQKKMQEEKEIISTDLPTANTSNPNMVSLATHPTSGGTIFSSQYWTISGEGQQRLNCTMDIFVDKQTLDGLPNLSIVAPEQQPSQCVRYGWLLLEHLLGSSEAISRSFAYTVSGTCPIDREELVAIVEKLCNGVLEHMERSFALDKSEDVRKEIMSLLKPKMETSFNALKGFKKNNQSTVAVRQPSDMFLQDHLKACSYPEEGRVQVAFGFDFYLDEEKLKEIEEQFKGGNEPQNRRCGRFGMHIVSDLVGGFDVFFNGRRNFVGATLALIGDDMFEAVYLRIQKTFGIEEALSVTQFRSFVQRYFERRKAVDVNKDTGLMASVLFQGPSISRSVSSVRKSTEDAPGQPGSNYWTTPAPSRTRLSPSSEFYMETTRLVEYQRYLGPECAKNKVNKDWPTYLKAVIQHAAGGEGEFLRRLLERRKAKNTMTVLEDALIIAIFEHVEHLFKAPKTRKHLPECVETFSSRQLELYDKGVTRWHFPALDERLRPEALIQLAEQEYWRQSGPDRTQIRPGHEVYIKTKVLNSIASYFGPQSKENCIKKYSYALLVHMLGGPETAHKLWSGKTFADGFRTMIVYDDLIAVCLHSDEAFHLMYSINPTGALIYAGVKMHRKDRHVTSQIKRIAKGSKLRHPRNLLHYALNVS